MDTIDKNILLDLHANCRTTYQEMAQKAGVSANAIKKRVNKMQTRGIIEGYYVELGLAMVDAEMSMAMVTTNGTEDEKEFTETIGKHSMVSYIGKLSGGLYNVFALYQGASGLSEMGVFLRNLPPVKQVELHPLLYAKGTKIELSALQLKVLRYLVDNPRAPISEVAKQSGFTSRMVSKTITELIDGGGVNFSIRWNPNVGGTTIMVRIHWDEKKADLNKILAFLQNRFGAQYFAPIISASLPLVFATFVVPDFQAVQEITGEIRKNSAIDSVISYLGEPSRVFPDIKSIRLMEMITEAGL